METSLELRCKSAMGFIQAFVFTRNTELLQYALNIIAEIIAQERQLQNDS